MKNIFKLIGIIAIIAVIGFSMTACENGNNNNDIDVTFISVIADGSSTQTTTKLLLTFSEVIAGISVSDITLSGVAGVTKGIFGVIPEITSSGKVYTLLISGFTSGGTLNVAIAKKTGYNIIGSPKTVTIYYSSNAGEGSHVTSDTSANKITVVGTDVYVLEGNGKYYWKNNVKIDVPNNGKAYDITVSGSDVYLAGYYNNGTTNIACYWKNETKTDFAYSSSSANYIAARNVTVVGSDVYVVATNLYWKNGERTSISTGVSNVDVNKTFGISVVGSDVYVGGYYYYNSGGMQYFWCYWKNGVKTTVNILPNMGGGVSAFTVSGSDIYFAGAYQPSNSSINRTPCYWKNGTRTNLSYSVGSSNNDTTAIVISGSDVYISGVDGSTTKACYWKNGTRTDLSTAKSSANDIFVTGSDIYVAGYEYSGDYMIACYWKNGVKTLLQ